MFLGYASLILPFCGKWLSWLERGILIADALGFASFLLRHSQAGLTAKALYTKTHMNVVVKRLLVNYRQSGKGRDVVIVHGWGDASTGFDGLSRALSESYRVTVCDLPGFGHSQAPTSAYGLSEYSQFVADFMNKINLSPFAIVGHSNGGAIALRGLAEDKFKCHKLVLLAAAGVRGENTRSKGAWWLAAKAGKVIASPLPKTAKARLRRRLYAAAGSDLLVMPHMEESFKKVVADDIRKDASVVKVPTLLIYGDQDADTPVSYGHMIADQLENCEMKVLLGAGHFVHKDQPSQTISLMKDFFNK